LIVNTRIATFAAFVGLSFGAAGLSSAATYKIDPVHSQLLFKVNHVGVSNQWGRINGLEGTFTTDEGKEAVDAKVPVEGIDTANPKRDQHLKSADFFNAKQFPEIAFKSNSVKKTDNGFELTGDLTLHGVTKSVTVPLTKVGEKSLPAPMGDRAGLEASFTVKRSDFGMGNMVGPIGDEVTLYVNVEGAKQ